MLLDDATGAAVVEGGKHVGVADALLEAVAQDADDRASVLMSRVHRQLGRRRALRRR
jgi:hypothetical protein